MDTPPELSVEKLIIVINIPYSKKPLTLDDRAQSVQNSKNLNFCISISSLKLLGELEN